MELTLLTTEGNFKHKVSSVLNKSSEFAGKHMFDYSNLESCWNSDGNLGSPQYILFDFLKPVVVKSLGFMFQGGFCGQDGLIEIGMAHSALKQVGTLDLIEDCNDLQSFDVDTEESCRYLKVSFATSTDFYGRVTLYKMEVFGYIVGDESTADDAIQS